ncbi:MAG TPA: TetR/AcrR family transcriptional regulator [Acidimicrobiia bacterium]
MSLPADTKALVPEGGRTPGRSRADVVEAAGRLFAARGYHGTSMRELGRALGLFGSSLYSHISSKEDLLVEVVARGADLFQRSAEEALSRPGPGAERLAALIEGHIAVVLDHLDEVRTFLYEAGALDGTRRGQVLAARDRYEESFRQVLAEGAADGSLAADLDPRLGAIFVLSILNAIERWYRPEGRWGREDLAARVFAFVREGIGP